MALCLACWLIAASSFAQLSPSNGGEQNEEPKGDQAEGQPVPGQPRLATGRDDGNPEHRDGEADQKPDQRSNRPSFLDAWWGEAFAPREWSQWSLLFVGVVTAALALITLRRIADQNAIGRDSADAARRAAEVAERSLLLADRPWLVLEPVHDVDELPESPFIRPVSPAAAAGALISYRIRNIGKSPAWVVSEGIACTFVPLPFPADLSEPEQGDPARLNPLPLPPGPSDQKAGEIVWLEHEQRQKMLHGEAVLALHGCIRYRDVLDHVHETSFCFLFHRSAMAAELVEGEWRGRTEWDHSPWIVLPGPLSYFRNT